MNRSKFFQLFNTGKFCYQLVRFNEPGLNLIIFSWKEISLTLDDLDYSRSSPALSYTGYDESGNESRLDFPVRMKRCTVELPFDLKKIKNHYVNMFGELILAHDIQKAFHKYYGDKELLEAVYDQDYIELAFLVEAKHKKSKTLKSKRND